MEERSLHIPVLLISFNRPDVTKIVLDKIVEVNPPKIYFFNDAPRTGNSNDKEKCAAVRDLVHQISYKGELITRFEETNLGCKGGESTSMSWLFENEEMGIVIEDDILPNNDFFFFCQEMLFKYKNDERIFSIGGCNLLNEWKSDIQDYHFALFGSFWGWAGWRRAWNYYNVEMPEWNNPRVKELVNNYLPSDVYRKLRNSEFDSLVDGRNDTWDFQFCLAHYLNHAVSIVPSKNLITNIGINRIDAVHMVGESPFSDLKHQNISFPVTHNPIMIPDYEYDNLVIKKAYPFLFEETPLIPKEPKKVSVLNRVKRKFL